MIPPSVTMNARALLALPGSGLLAKADGERAFPARPDAATFQTMFRTTLAQISPNVTLEPAPTRSEVPADDDASTRGGLGEEGGLALDADGEAEDEEPSTDVLSLLAPLVVVAPDESPKAAVATNADPSAAATATSTPPGAIVAAPAAVGLLSDRALAQVLSALPPGAAPPSGDDPPHADEAPRAEPAVEAERGPALRLVSSGPGAAAPLAPAASHANDASVDFQWPVAAELRVEPVHVHGPSVEAWRSGEARITREIERLHPRLDVDRAPRSRADVAAIALALRPIVIQELAPTGAPDPGTPRPANEAAVQDADAPRAPETRRSAEVAPGERRPRPGERAEPPRARRSEPAPARIAERELAERGLSVEVPELAAKPEAPAELGAGLTSYAHKSPLREALSAAADQVARGLHDEARARRQRDAEEGANRLTAQSVVEARANVEGLGRVTVRVAPERHKHVEAAADAQAVRVTAERPETVELLHRTRDALFDDLRSASPTVSSLDVGSEGASSRSHRQPNDGRALEPAPQGDGAPSAEPVTTRAASVTADGRVRIVL